MPPQMIVAAADRERLAPGGVDDVRHQPVQGSIGVDLAAVDGTVQKERIVACTVVGPVLAVADGNQVRRQGVVERPPGGVRVAEIAWISRIGDDVAAVILPGDRVSAKQSVCALKARQDVRGPRRPVGMNERRPALQLVQAVAARELDQRQPELVRVAECEVVRARNPCRAELGVLPVYESLADGLDATARALLGLENGDDLVPLVAELIRRAQTGETSAQDHHTLAAGLRCRRIRAWCAVGQHPHPSAGHGCGGCRSEQAPPAQPGRFVTSSRLGHPAAGHRSTIRHCRSFRRGARPDWGAGRSATATLQTTRPESEGSDMKSQLRIYPQRMTDLRRPDPSAGGREARRSRRRSLATSNRAALRSAGRPLRAVHSMGTR